MTTKRTIICILAAFLVLSAAQARAANDDVAALQTVIIATGEKVAPAVVQIRVYRKTDEVKYEELPTPPMLQQSLAAGYATRPYGPCSGVCIDKDGYVLTSFFNVDGQIDHITVTFGNGKRYGAALLGYSKDYDVALLKVDNKGAALPFLPLSNKTPAVGSFTMAIGRAENVFQHTLDFGIITATGRHRPEIQALQFDAHVNYGNSGGALVDIEGNLLGIVAFIYPTSQSVPGLGLSSGVGLANTSQKLASMLADLKAGKVLALPQRPFIGIKMEESYSKNDGALIQEVIKGTAAEAAGLTAGDLVVAIDGKAVANSTELVGILKTKKIGDKVQLQVKRGGKTMTIDITLRPAPPGM